MRTEASLAATRTLLAASAVRDIRLYTALGRRIVRLESRLPRPM